MARRGEIKETIKVLLENKPNLREDVNYLISHIWRHQAKELGITASEDIFRCMCDKTLWNAETIRRTRRILVRENPRLGPSPVVQQQNMAYEQIIRQNGGEM